MRAQNVTNLTNYSSAQSQEHCSYSRLKSEYSFTALHHYSQDKIMILGRDNWCIRYYDRSGDSYSGSSDEYNLSDPQQYLTDSDPGSRHKSFYNSHPPRRKFSPNLSSR